MPVAGEINIDVFIERTFTNDTVFPTSIYHGIVNDLAAGPSSQEH